MKSEGGVGSHVSVVFGGHPSQTGTEGSATLDSSSLGKRKTAQCQACPAKTPTPRNVSESATCSCTATECPDVRSGCMVWVWVARGDAR
jgi:hypothetical protein